MNTLLIVGVLGAAVFLTSCVPFYVEDRHEHRHDRYSNYDRHPVRVEVVPVVEVRR